PIRTPQRRSSARPEPRATDAAGERAPPAAPRSAPPPLLSVTPELPRGEPSGSGNFRPLRRLDLVARAAEAALAGAVRHDRGIERRGVEVRPERVGEAQLRVRELPEEEVADALLAAGADEQIGLGRVAHRQVRREVFLAHVFPRRIVLRKTIEGL